jgi:hypothetical protein
MTPRLFHLNAPLIFKYSIFAKSIVIVPIHHSLSLLRHLNLFKGIEKDLTPVKLTGKNW